MAVSNAVGSNIFDILICLGVPWFLRTTVIGSGDHVAVHSKGTFNQLSILVSFYRNFSFISGMVYSTVMLLSTVVLLITAIHKNGWKLDKKFGIVLMIGYVVFITIATFYELFGPGSCDNRVQITVT